MKEDKLPEGVGEVEIWHKDDDDFDGFIWFKTSCVCGDDRDTLSFQMERNKGKSGVEWISNTVCQRKRKEYFRRGFYSWPLRPYRRCTLFN